MKKEHLKYPYDEIRSYVMKISQFMEVNEDKAHQLEVVRLANEGRPERLNDLQLYKILHHIRNEMYDMNVEIKEFRKKTNLRWDKSRNEFKEIGE